MKNIKKSLLAKNVAINLIIVIVLILSIASVTYKISSDKITSEIQTQISITLDKVIGEVEAVRLSQEQQLTIISKSEGAVEFFKTGESGNFKKQVDSMVSNFPEYLENVLLIGKDGKVTYDSNGKSFVGTDLSEREYFKDSLKGETAHSDVLKSKATGNYIEVISVPVYDGEDIIGVAIATMNINYIKEILEPVKIGKSGYAYLIDNAGNFIYHPKEELIGGSVEDLKIKEINAALSDMQNGKSGIVYYTFGGYDKMNSYKPIGAWSMNVNAVESEYLAAVSEMLKDIIILGIIMLIIAVAASFINSYRMVKKIRKVQNVLGVVTSGDLTVKIDENNLKKCWEVLNCEKKDCPAYKNKDLKCWEIKGTLCDGLDSDDGVSKLKKCQKCGVYRATEGDELSQMSRSLSTMITTLRDVIDGIIAISQRLSSSGQQLSASSEETTASAENISERMEEISSGSQSQTEYIEKINQMAEDMENILEKALKDMNVMVENAAIVNATAENGQIVIDKTITGMSDINIQTEKVSEVMNKLILQSKEIEEINNLITSIAEETNLLALNASIEAARAGENGRGFAVVAEKIGKLASQSQESANGIAELIKNISQNITSVSNLMGTEAEYVKEGIKSVEESKASFGEISGLISSLESGIKDVGNSVNDVMNSSSQVAVAVNQMTGIIEEFSGEIEEITASTEEQTAISEEISISASDLANMAENLMESVKQFKV